MPFAKEILESETSVHNLKAFVSHAQCESLRQE